MMRLLGPWFLLLALAAPPAGAEPLRVMSFNLWVGGDACGLGREVSLDAQKLAIRYARADVVGLQEQADKATSRAEVLARELGWNCHLISTSRAVISRFPIEPVEVIEPQPAKHHRSAGRAAQAVRVTLPSGKKVVVGVVHLAPAPYQPYEIVKGHLKCAAEAEENARIHRLPELESLLAQVAPEQEKGTPVIVLGDFNEPSCEDWTTATVTRRTNPEFQFGVEWPCSRMMLEKGFVDTYRAIHPDPVAKPGNTWTSLAEPQANPEVMDRIDLIYVTRSNTEVREVKVVGEKGPESDLAVEPWPSDHRAVVAEIDLK